MEKFYTLFLDYGFCIDGMQSRGGTLILLVPSINHGFSTYPNYRNKKNKDIYNVPHNTMDFQECPNYSVQYSL